MSLQTTAGDLLGHLNRLRPAVAWRDRSGTSLLRLQGDGSKVDLSVQGLGGPEGPISATRSLEASWKAPETLVPFAQLYSMVRMLDGPDSKVTLEAATEEVVIASGPMNLRLRTVPNDPGLVITPKWEGAGVAEWNAPALRPHAQLAATAASRDDGRPILTGLYLHQVTGEDDRLTIAATDSYRLIVRKLEAEPIPQELLLPGRLGRLLSGEATTLTIGRSPHAWLGWTDEHGTTWRTRTMEGQFPNYLGLIPSRSEITLKMPRDKLLALLGRARRFAGFGGTNTPVKLEIDSAGVTFSVKAEDVGHYEEFLHCNVEGQPRGQVVAYNPGYLIDGVKAIDTPVVSLSLVDERKPSVLSTENLTFLLMPVRVS